ncbi:TPR-like protein [Lojkania enalia]|uniref:TPR-like protein n=1 Tax=Lojkania enalia TaxID=147567 RepID=A0A9P4N7Z1_9PLEO|nr:TPR-like protein [Didymosphaeria enalia]
MDPPTANQPSWAQDDFLNPVQSHYVAHQVYEPYSIHMPLDIGLQTQLQGGYYTTSQSAVPHPLDPSLAPRIYDYHYAEVARNVESMSATSMGPPPRKRQRKAPTLRADAWEPYKDRIIELHITQKLPLRKVKEIIKEEYGFTAELRQYRTRVSQWGKDKNIKPKEMKAIVRKKQRRKLVEVAKPQIEFTVRGSLVESPKIDRWMKRNNVTNSSLYAPSPAESTPSAVECRTISELGSPVPSPAYSPAASILLPGGIISVAQNSRMVSPALSAGSIVQLQNSSFAGQSPAPTYRSLPQSIPIEGAYEGILNPRETSLQYRYRQTDEERLREELLRAETLFGINHTETLDIRSELGEVLMAQGRYKSAEKVIRRLMKGRQTLNGHDVETLDALELLGQVLAHQGLYAKEEKMHRRTLEFRKDMLGDEHPSTLTSMANLASTLWNQGRWKEAEELGNQGRWKEAEELEVQVMEMRKRVLGDEHPDTLTSMANLAYTWKSQSQNKEAISLIEKCIKLQRQIHGPGHPDTVCSLTVLYEWQKETLG